MSPNGTMYKVAGPHIVHETFEDEVVLINFNTGSYYSLGNTGVVIWNFIQQGMSLECIAQAVLDRFDVTPETLDGPLHAFIADLQTEKLIVADQAGQQQAQAGAQAIPQPAAGKVKFDPPMLQKFTDIQEIIMLDPIHDVNEKGWPHKNPDPENADGHGA